MIKNSSQAYTQDLVTYIAPGVQVRKVADTGSHSLTNLFLMTAFYKHCCLAFTNEPALVVSEIVKNRVFDEDE